MRRRPARAVVAAALLSAGCRASAAAPLPSIAALRSAAAPRFPDSAAAALYPHATGAAGCAGSVSGARLVSGLEGGVPGRGPLAVAAPGARLTDLLGSGAGAAAGGTQHAPAPPSLAIALPGPPPDAPWSPDEANPQAAWAPVRPPDGWAWVPGGCGALTSRLPFLFVDAFGPSADDAASRASDNEEALARSGRRRWPAQGAQAADADVRMAAAGGGGRTGPPAPAAAAQNASACLAAGTCQPVGGHSVWAAFGGSDTDEGAVLVVAPADARSLGRGAGGAGPAGSAGRLSGLVAALAAAELLGNASATPGFPGARSSPVLVAALAAEAWGYVGSGRLLAESAGGPAGGPGQGRDGAGGFPATSITHLLEVGAVGDGHGPAALFVHPALVRRGRAERSDPAAAALVAAAAATPATASLAPPTNPGPPPSSSWALAPRLPALRGAAVLSAHASSLGGAHWASRWDERLDEGAVAAAAAATAAAAASLARWPALPATAPESLAARVRDLAGCILGAGHCALAPAWLGPAEAAAFAPGRPSPFAHAGPLATIGPDPQAPPVVSPASRFLWEALARAAGGGEGGGRGAKCKGAGDCGGSAVCVGAGSPAGGACSAARVRFVAAYPLGLECAGCADPDPKKRAWGEWVASTTNGSSAAAWTAAGAPPWPTEPLWCESVWPAGGVPSLTLYRAEPAGAGRGALLAGVVASTVAAVAGRAASRELVRVA